MYLNALKMLQVTEHFDNMLLLKLLCFESVSLKITFPGPWDITTLCV